MVVSSDPGSDLGKTQLEELCIAFTLLQNADEVQKFLQDLFTEREIANAAKRWCIVQRLFEGDIQQIAINGCQADKNTVSRANRTVVNGGTGVSKIIWQRLEAYKRGLESE